MLPGRFRAPQSVRSPKPLEQLNLTMDKTEYVAYSTVLRADSDAVKACSGTGTCEIEIGSRISNAFAVYVGTRLIGQFDNHAHGYGAITLKSSLPAPLLRPADGDAPILTLLSTSLGMHSHVGTSLDFKGIVGAVKLGGVDITSNAGGWAHGVGLLGEAADAKNGTGSSTVRWGVCSATNHTRAPSVAQNALTWWRADFALARLPSVKPFETVLLDLYGMSRGHFSVNGHDLGKYWLINGPSGRPTQRYYHVPVSVLRFGTGATNTLVLGDELGAPNASAPRIVFSSMVESTAK